MDKELPKGILDEEKKDTDSEPERGSDEEASGSDAEEAASLPPSQQLESEPASITSTKPKQKCNVWFCVSSPSSSSSSSSSSLLCSIFHGHLVLEC